MIKVINSNPPVLRDSDTPTVQHRWFQAFGISFPTDQRSTKPRSRSIKLSLVIRIQMAQATTNRINNPGRVRATGVSTGLGQRQTQGDLPPPLMVQRTGGLGAYNHWH